jgi:hypothetical protein
MAGIVLLGVQIGERDQIRIGFAKDYLGHLLKAQGFYGTLK